MTRTVRPSGKSYVAAVMAQDLREREIAAKNVSDRERCLALLKEADQHLIRARRLYIGAAVMLALIAALLCATAANADPVTHRVIVHTPGGDVASEPMTRPDCMEKAAAIHGRVFPVPIKKGGVPVIVMVRLFASCVPLGVAS